MAPASALEVVAHRVVWSLVLLLAVLGASRQLAGLRHRLSAPPRGYHWVQVGADYALVAVATGVILQMLLAN